MNAKHQFSKAKSRTMCCAAFCLALGWPSASRLQAQCYIDPVTGQRVCAVAPGSPPGARAPARDSRSLPLDASAHCRITVGDGSAGSGVLVSRDAATGLVLTCSHLFDGSTSRIVVEFPNGQRFAARILDRDAAHDLAALAIRRPSVEPLVVTDGDPSGTLAACGFGPNGQFRTVRGNIIGRAVAVGATHASLMIQGAVRPGDSGGGVLDAAGRLVGIVWGQRDGATYATCGRPVRDFLARVLAASAAAESNRRSTQPPKPRAEEHNIATSDESSRRPPAPSPHLDWHTWSNEIETRIRTLDASKQDKGDYLQHGDLNGYVRTSDLPKIDESKFAKRTELEKGLSELTARFTTFRSRMESIEENVTQIATAKGRLLHGLSLSKLLAATLGLSGPMAAAVIVAAGLVGRILRGRIEGQVRTSSSNSRSSPLAQRLAPVAVDSPPPPQRTIQETHYVPYEKDSFAKAHQWASEQVARKYPGATEVLQAQDSLIKQYIAAQ